MKKLFAKVKAVLEGKRGEGYIDTGVKDHHRCRIRCSRCIPSADGNSNVFKEGRYRRCRYKVIYRRCLVPRILRWRDRLYGWSCLCNRIPNDYNKVKKQSNKEPFPLLPFLSTGLMIGYFI